jgi:NTP pyrophosphatase (non-canonical NTP hydrolase)
VNLNDYSNFVLSVMSSKSKNIDELIDVLNILNQQDINSSLLLTAEVGLSGETGEFSDIVKKILFQGKQLDEKTRVHLEKELGDIIFYWITACRALNVDPNNIIHKNYEKLSSRYPDGFSIQKSENKAKDDL